MLPLKSAAPEPIKTPDHLLANCGFCEMASKATPLLAGPCQST